MKKYLQSMIALSTAFVISASFTSCGMSAIKEYETEHDCGTYVIAGFEDIDKLAFAEHTPLKTVAKNFKNFSYYKLGDDSSITTYAAHIPVDMSLFFESEVIIAVDDSDNDEQKTQSFPDYIADQKAYRQEQDLEYQDYGDGSDAELYIYFNADKEFSGWQLCPNNTGLNAETVFWETFNNHYTCVSYDIEVKTKSMSHDGKTFDLPYFGGSFSFKFGDSFISVHSNDSDHAVNDKTNYIVYVP